MYLDDIIVLGKSFENGLGNLRNVLHRFRDFNLKLKPKKCELFKDQAEFLGKLAIAKGVSVSPYLCSLFGFFHTGQTLYS